MIMVYIFGIILALFILLCLFFLLAPISYKLEGGYEQSLKINAIIRFLAFLVIKARWDSSLDKPGQIKISIAGLSFSMHPEKWGKKDQKPGKKEKEGLPFGKILRTVDREFLRNGLSLFTDMLKILRPEKIALRGRVGFDEPHLTGWLTAFGYMIRGFCKGAVFALEPVWHEEYYEINLSVEGKILSAVVLLRIVRFMLSRRTRQFLKLLKQEKAAYAS